MAIDVQFDQTNIWHPYTSMVTPLPSYPVVRAEGCELTLENGQTLVDGMASWWCAIHGYNVPELNQAAIDQINELSHVMFGGLTHEPAVSLCRKLVDLTPPPLEKVFLADSGSVAVEVALKMAIQYWRGRGDDSRVRFASFLHGYHGDTFGAMSVCDPVNGMHALFKGVLHENIFLPAPRLGYSREPDQGILGQWQTILKENRDSLAAVIIEPVVQGAGGMRIYNPAWLVSLKALCQELDILLIFDEIATGFGRTGKLFGMDHAGVSPDILCLGKALTGGYMTLSATLTTSHVAETICQSAAGVFMHGPTFMGNPLACRVACASIDRLARNEFSLLARVGELEKRLTEQLEPLREHEGVRDVRVLGAIGVVELVEPVNMAVAQRFFVESGVWIRPFGKLFYVMPPFVITDEQLLKLTNTMRRFVEKRPDLNG